MIIDVPACKCSGIALWFCLYFENTTEFFKVALVIQDQACIYRYLLPAFSQQHLIPIISNRAFPSLCQLSHSQFTIWILNQMKSQLIQPTENTESEILHTATLML